MQVKKIIPQGIIPATLACFNPDFSLDLVEMRKHLRDVSVVEGLTAITVNGHASEIHACSFKEQQSILCNSLEELGDRLPLINGVYADGSLEAARIARMADQEGASALLVFPPNSMSMGGQLRPDMAIAHFKTIADTTDLPLILFQYPLNTGLGYPIDTLVRIAEEVPSIIAIKDWCNDPSLHERHIRTLHKLPRRVNVLTTHSSWLLASLVMGAAGILSGAGSVIADLLVLLFQAVKCNDLAEAQAINARIYPLVQAFYSPPFLDMHNRMKECLLILGRLEKAYVRPPLVKLPPEETERLREALLIAGLL